MTKLELFRESCLLSRQQLGRSLRLPPQSVQLMESRDYPFHLVNADSRSELERGLQRVLNTTLTLNEMLAEA